MLSKIKIHPTTIVYFILSLLGGYFKQFLIIFVIIMIHELFHTMAAWYYHFDIARIMVMPFGAFVELNDFGIHHVLSEMIVVLAGLFSHVIMTVGILLLNHFQLVSTHNFNFIMSINISVFFLNILPVWPLDGAKLIHLLLCYLFPYKTTLFLIWIISMITFSIFVSYHGFQANGYVIYTYLIYHIYVLYQNIEYLYFRFLYDRFKHNIYKKVKINKKERFYRPFENIFIYQKKIYTEKEYIKKYLNSSRRK